MFERTLAGSAIASFSILFFHFAGPSISISTDPSGDLFHDGFESATTIAWSSTEAPVYVEIVSPAAGAFVNDATPDLVVRTWSPTGDGVDTSTLAFTIGGVPRPFDCVFDGELATCTPQEPLAEGVVGLTAQVSDLLARPSPIVATTFSIDTTAPTITIESPSDGLLTSQISVTVAGSLDQQAKLTLNFQPVALAKDFRFVHQVPLEEGLNLLTLRAVDAAGNLATRTLTVTRDTTPPLPIRTALVTVTVEEGSVVVVGASGAAEGSARVRVRNLRTGGVVEVMAATDGSFVAELAGELGNVLAAEVEDAVGLVSLETEFPAPYALLPDPASFAPPLGPTVPYSLHKALEFLYTGPSPTQVGVAPGTIERRRVAWLRGEVRERGGEPLAGVRVKVLGHPEYGSTSTRADGVFDLVVNGGGPLTISYERAGFLPVQRLVEAGWRESAFAPDVVMIRLDRIVTAIQMAAPEAQIALSTSEEDIDGRRSATLIFQSGTTATLLLAGGNTQDVAELHVRATEYTVGEEGPAAMPGPLPAGVGYTYAVELSADEAMAANAKRIEFSQPVAVYVDNFLGFPTGTRVPLGSYDFAQGLWIGSPDGKVVSILGIDEEGRAKIDVDGSNTAADPATLASLGITDGERSLLASHYGERISLWRGQIPHFSPWDFNWPVSPPDDAMAPPEWPDMSNEPDLGDDDGSDEDESDEDDSEGETPCGPEDEGSVIDCESMELRKEVEVVGTPFRLAYSSSRVPSANAAMALRVPVSGPQIPASLRAMEVEVTGMAQRVSLRLPPEPRRTVVIPTQNVDGFGRPIAGKLRVSTDVRYRYPAVYRATQSQFATSWARFADEEILAGGYLGGFRSAETLTLGRRSTQTTDQLLKRTTGYWDNRAQKLGGWSLDEHHVYDPESRTLYRGDGTKVVGRAVQTRLKVFAGTGAQGFAGDGGPALGAVLDEPGSPAMARDGSIYFADVGNQRIRVVRPDGVIQTVAGTGSSCATEGGGGLGEEVPTGGLPCADDGLPALEVGLNEPSKLTFGPDGRLYFVDSAQDCVRRYDPRTGGLERVAGVCHWVDGGPGGGLSEEVDRGEGNGDGGPARLATVHAADIAVRRDGTLLIVDGGLREVTPDGIIETIFEDAGFTAIAIGANEELYLAGQGKVFRLRPNGSLEDFAGGGDGSNGCTRDGQPALGADLCGFVHDLQVGRDGRLHVQAGERVLRIETDGTLSTVFGPQLPGPPPTGEGRGGQRQRGALGSMRGFTVDDTGAIWAADPLSHTLWQASIDAPDFIADELLLPNRSGNEVYVFNRDGRHLRTRHGLTGTTLYEFEYDPEGFIRKVTDVDGLETTIHRLADGTATAIESPFGQVTTLAIGEDGWLSSATNPAKETHSFAYQGGLMTRHRDPRQIEKTYQFAGLGRLRHLENADGGTRSYSRVRREGATDFTVTKTSEEGIRESFTLRQARHGETRREIVAADQTRTTTVIGRHGDTEITRPDGAVSQSKPAVDPRWGLLAAYDADAVLTLPSGKAIAQSNTRLAPLLDASDPFSFTGIEQRRSVNGKEYLSHYDAATHRTQQSTPMGRSAAASFDAKGRARSIEPPGVAALALSYTNGGKLDTLTSGSGLAQRVVDFRYDARNRLDQVLDPEGRAVAFGYDDANRVTSTTLPDKATVNFSFDAASNVTSVTPPGRPAHTFTYTPSNRLQAYQLPDVGNGPATETRIYDADLRLTTVTRPDGKVVGFA
jgi:YD repeat-containing protein